MTSEKIRGQKRSQSGYRCSHNPTKQKINNNYNVRKIVYPFDYLYVCAYLHEAYKGQRTTLASLLKYHVLRFLKEKFLNIFFFLELSKLCEPSKNQRSFYLHLPDAGFLNVYCYRYMLGLDKDLDAIASI